MLTGIRFRCHPTAAQRLTLARWMGCQRAIYNAKVAEDRYYRTFRKHALSHTGTQIPIDQTFARYKDPELTPWLSEVPSQILRNGATRFAQAYSRFFQGLAHRPTLKKKAGRQVVWLTDDLFRFEPTCDPAPGKFTSHRLVVGTTKFPVGEISFPAHRPYGIPKSIVLSREGGRWFVAFAYEDGNPTVDPQAIIDRYAVLPEAVLKAKVEGYDRGVAVPVMGSKQGAHDFTPGQQAHLIQLDAKIRRVQRILSHRQKGSNRRERAKLALGRTHAVRANIRRDFAHQTSHRFATSPVEVFVAEDLKLRNMTRRPKPKRNQTKGYLPNGAKAKAGLNRSLLNAALGMTWRFLQYKAVRHGKLTIEVPPQQSSQECAACGHTHPDNRPSQAVFRCQDCGHTDHADHNAAVVVEGRGLRMLRAGEVRAKASKVTLRMAKQSDHGRAGTVRTAGGLTARNARGESVSRRAGAPVPAHGSGKREAPTMTSSA